MKLDFRLNSAGDTILFSEEYRLDLGYSFNEKLPILLWCSYKQLANDDLFAHLSRKNCPQHSDGFPIAGEISLERCIDTSRIFYSTLPTTETKFNLGLQVIGLSEFSAGYHLIRHTFSINDGALHLVSDREQDAVNKIRFLESNQHREFLDSYLQFLQTEPKMENVLENVLDSIAFARTPLDETDESRQRFLEILRN